MSARLRFFSFLGLALFTLGCVAPPPVPIGPDCTAQSCVAITFDGGPNGNSAAILDILAVHSAKATFFVIGSKVEAAPELVARMAAEGHEIGNHSWSHVPLPRLTEAEILDELAATNQVISAAAEGYTPQVFRPPYGSYSPRVAAIVPYIPVLWSLDPNDWEAGGEADIIRAVSNARPGEVVLLHSFSGATVRALPQILQNLEDKGFIFVTVSQLLAAQHAVNP